VSLGSTGSVKDTYSCAAAGFGFSFVALAAGADTDFLTTLSFFSSFFSSYSDTTKVIRF